MSRSTQSVDLKIGETLYIGGSSVTLVEKSGRMARLRISAEDSVVIERPKPATSMAHRGVLQEATPTGTT